MFEILAIGTDEAITWNDVLLVLGILALIALTLYLVRRI